MHSESTHSASVAIYILKNRTEFMAVLILARRSLHSICNAVMKHLHLPPKGELCPFIVTRVAGLCR
jgi:hypothetical protein